MFVTYRSRSHILLFFLYKFSAQVCKILHHPNIFVQFSYYVQHFILTIFTHASDLEVKVTEFDISVDVFIRFCDLV